MAGTVTVNTLLELLGTEFTDTVTGPVVTLLAGTATIEPLLQLVMEAAGTPLKLTVLLPCVEPKFVPVIVTGVPATPELGDTTTMFGVGMTVKPTPLLTRLFTLTVRFTEPLGAVAGTGTTIDVAFQLVAVALTPLKLAMTESYESPKFVPVIVIAFPAEPEPGDTPVTLGVAKMLNVTPLLTVPFTVMVTGPLVAPLGTVTKTWVSLQLVAVALTPLKETVLEP
jgi:hypothetical protein